jgi:hypothetical protein
LIEAAQAGRTEFDESPHVEEQIYSSFIPNGDRAKMEAFHVTPGPSASPSSLALKINAFAITGFAWCMSVTLSCFLLISGTSTARTTATG